MQFRSTCVVNLIESSNIYDMPRYIFSIFSVLNAMINLEQPQINIITKIDLLKELDIETNEKNEPNDAKANETPITYPLSFYKNPHDEEKINDILDNLNINPKFKKLNKLISQFVVDFGLVSFDVLDVKNQKQLNKIANLIDKANGYIYLDTGSLKDEKYIEIRNIISKNTESEEDD